MYKRFISITIIIAVLLTALSACGSNKEAYSFNTQPSGVDLANTTYEGSSHGFDYYISVSDISFIDCTATIYYDITYSNGVSELNWSDTELFFLEECGGDYYYTMIPCGFKEEVSFTTIPLEYDTKLKVIIDDRVLSAEIIGLI